MTCSVTPLNKTQLEQLATNAGFTSSMSGVMAAIALAESGGCPTATNPIDNGGKQTSWGLWQLSDGTHNTPNGWNNPQVNANMAYQKYKSQGLGAWGTYTTGKYKNYLGPSSNTDTTGSTPPLPANLASLPFGIGGAIQAVQQTATNFFEEVGIFLIAFLIIALGVFLLAQQNIEQGVKAIA